MKYSKAIGVMGAIWTGLIALAIIAFGVIFNGLAGMAGSIIGGAPPSRVLLFAATVGGWALLLIFSIRVAFRYRATGVCCIAAWFLATALIFSGWTVRDLFPMLVQLLVWFAPVTLFMVLVAIDRFWKRGNGHAAS